jgi:hypothetical protein
MAHCPKCKKTILWDWDQDIYVFEDGTELETMPAHPKEEHDYEVGCSCQTMVAKVIDNEDGMEIDNEDWATDIDWQEDEHCFNSQRNK